MATMTETTIRLRRLPTKVKRIELRHIPGEGHSNIWCFGMKCQSERIEMPAVEVLATRERDGELHLLIQEPDGASAAWLDVRDSEIIESQSIE